MFSPLADFYGSIYQQKILPRGEEDEAHASNVVQLMLARKWGAVSSGVCLLFDMNKTMHEIVEGFNGGYPDDM